MKTRSFFFQKSLQVVERAFCLKLEADAILSSHRYIEGQFDSA